MSFLFGDQPTPPNPYQTAAAQTGTNVATGVANSFLNNVNQNTPDGSLRYDVTGNYGWTDPSTGQTYQLPTFTSTQSLSPQSQAIKSQTDAAKMNLAGLANSQSASISNLLGSAFNPNVNAQQYLQSNPDVLAYAQQHGLDPTQFAAQHYSQFGIGEGRSGGVPSGGNAQNLANIPGAQTSYASGGPIQSSLGNYGQQQSTFGDAGDITRSYGPSDNFSADRQRVEDSLMARMNPQLQQEQQRVQQQLADQGIRYGSQAYTSAMDNYNRQANDARYGAIAQGGQEQQRMNDMAAKLAGFQNAAQQQAYTQAQGRGEFANQAQAQNYNQALGAGTFANAAQGQQYGQNAGMASFANAGLAQQLAQQQSIFNAQNAQRNQSMQEQYAQRNQPLNEISALMAGSQVQSPNWLNSPTSQIATTDVGGLINTNFNQQMQNYQQQSANTNNLIGGILGLGAGALRNPALLSDRREKKNIDRMGTVFAAGDDGEKQELPIYQYSYKNDPASTRHVGPMAQDVERIEPKAVQEREGRKYINPRRVMGSILRAA